MYDLCRFSLCSDSAEPPVRKQRVDLTREKATAASTPREKERTVSESQEIPTGEPILPPPPASARLPFARLLHMSGQAGTIEEASEELDDELREEIRVSPPPFEDYHGENLEEDPQLTQRNLNKFQENIQEFSQFSVVSDLSSTFFLCSMCSVY